MAWNLALGARAPSRCVRTLCRRHIAFAAGVPCPTTVHSEGITFGPLLLKILTQLHAAKCAKCAALICAHA